MYTLVFKRRDILNPIKSLTPIYIVKQVLIKESILRVQIKAGLIPLSESFPHDLYTLHLEKSYFGHCRTVQLSLRASSNRRLN